jgi:hypothetical protein
MKKYTKHSEATDDDVDGNTFEISVIHYEGISPRQNSDC